MRLAIALLVLILAGCGTAVPSATPVLTSSPATAPSPTASARPTTSSDAVEIDPSLLDHLPAQVDGLDVMRSPEFDALAATDSAVVTYGEAIVTAIVADPASEQFATVTIVRLRPNAFDDQRFRDWRDSFDEGVCERAGGIVRNGEAMIGGHTTYIGTCAEGVHTYHVWLRNSRILLSISSLGERRLGELLVEGLRD